MEYGFLSGKLKPKFVNLLTEMQWPSLERLPLMDLSSSSLISFSAGEIS